MMAQTAQIRTDTSITKEENGKLGTCIAPTNTTVPTQTKQSDPTEQHAIYFPNLTLPVEKLSASSFLHDFGVRLRPATVEDGNACFTLIADVMLEFGLTGRPIVQKMQKQQKKRKTGDPRKRMKRGLADVLDPSKHYPDNQRCCLEVVEDAKTGEIVGTVGYAALKRDPSVFELKRLYLRPDQRGKGLGLRLFERRLRAISLFKPTKVVTTIAAPLAANLHLHSSHGFEIRDGVTKGYNQGDYLCVWVPVSI
jgi:GNAT superfamily N-acetyltransferase